MFWGIANWNGQQFNKACIDKTISDIFKQALYFVDIICSNHNMKRDDSDNIEKKEIKVPRICREITSNFIYLINKLINLYLIVKYYKVILVI